MRFIQFSFALAACLQAHLVFATPLERGAMGLTEIAVTLNNSGATPIACGATLAHWYSQPLGTIQPGASLHAKLWQKQQTGAVYLLNQIEDRMPVERLWCGVAGQSWQTRSEVTFERKASVSVASIVMTCAAKADGVQCSQN